MDSAWKSVSSVGSSISSSFSSATSSISSSNVRHIAGSMKFLPFLYLMVGGVIALLMGTSIKGYMYKNKLFIASIVLFLFVGLVGLITIFSTQSGMSSSDLVKNHRFILTSAGYLLIIAIGLFMAGVATTPNPEFEDKEEEEPIE